MMKIVDFRIKWVAHIFSKIKWAYPFKEDNFEYVLPMMKFDPDKLEF